MSLSAKLAAYRVLGEAVEYLAASTPSRISVRIHCTTKPDGRRMICMSVRALSPSLAARTSSQTAQLAQLRNRVMAYGGSLHNRPRRLRMIVLDEPMEAGRGERPVTVDRTNVRPLRERALTR